MNASTLSSQDLIPSRDLIGSPICALPFNHQIDLMIDWAKNHQSKMVYVANVHMVIEAWQRPNFAEAMKKADLVTPDGLPLVWMLKLLGAKWSERVAGMDIFRETCKKASQNHLSVFLLGSTPEILDKISQRLGSEFPSLEIAGVESPPFRPLGMTPDLQLVDRINASNAKIVFVALGCPKQELWMLQHRDQIQAVMVGVGGVFPVYAGILKATPKLIQNTGFEWLFRLVQEPRRLWKRYAITIPIFIFLSVHQLLLQSMRGPRESHLG
jgi:N-acetylglucosaminyldiphosphoundecaprenol N-acetyl-beta-D-mannosaminyltransferase